MNIIGHSCRAHTSRKFWITLILQDITLLLRHSRISPTTSGEKKKREVEFGCLRWMVVGELDFE